jgi:hypothetical protein
MVICGATLPTLKIWCAVSACSLTLSQYVLKVHATIPEGDSLSPAAPFRVVNIGNSDKVRLSDFVEAIEQEIGKPAIRNYLEMQKGDVPATWADASLLQRLTGFSATNRCARRRAAVRRVVSRILFVSD